MKERVRRGYEGVFSDHVTGYDKLGTEFQTKAAMAQLEEMDLQLEREGSPKEAIPEDDLFEKIELEEILEKVEQLKPSLEKEWPSEKGVGVSEEKRLMIEEPTEKPLDLSEFEAALQGEIKAEGGRVEVEPLAFEIPRGEVREEVIPIEESAEEEELKDLDWAGAEAISQFHIKGVVTGAVESVYQAERIQRMCNRFGIAIEIRLQFAYWVVSRESVHSWKITGCLSMPSVII
jgi:hypothetical protein